MALKILHKYSHINIPRNSFHLINRNASIGLTNFEQKDLTSELKNDIEKHWRDKLETTKFNPANADGKFYILSMFPYPSGKLHMGHVRVYTISDALARFNRMNGKNVLHPMGWDAFGLPAENAANQKSIPADLWTKDNIVQMKNQLIDLGCSFDWDRELATCDPTFYKWTQWLFLKLFNAGLAYQKEASVNWDPIDNTVLANEQVDENGNSWRSGAKVETKLLRQWFIKTTKFSKSLYDRLESHTLDDWRDIVKIQKHWIGECNGFRFDLTTDNGSVLNVWTKTPEHFESAAFIAVGKDHVLNSDKIADGMLDFRVNNPFNGKSMPVLASGTIEFPHGCDTYLGLPSVSECDKEVAFRHNITLISENIVENLDRRRQRILSKAQSLNIGGFACSSHLKDWLISRQRHWGTPIPIIHCQDCGAVPVAESDLPVVHSMNTSTDQLKTTCPKCKNPNALRESDTMDTFVDSSWYFLRYLDPKNDTDICDKNLARIMPVDLYIGGKEHALLHLYYARCMNNFLHTIGLVPHAEPFKNLVVQGMVMGQSYRVKSTGKYLKASEVRFDSKKNEALEISTGEAVGVQWEKMSKSKLNGIDPADVFAEHSIDSVRLIMLGDFAPTTQRNWSPETFPSILEWQKRLWLTLNQFHKIRSDDCISKIDTSSASFVKYEAKLQDSRNNFVKHITFNYKYSHQLNRAVTSMHGLTKAIREKAPMAIIKHSAQYERALASLIVMLAPMAPHFASELWSLFLRVPNRINTADSNINWDSDVLQQSWPKIDPDYPLNLKVMVNGFEKGVLKFAAEELEKIDLKLALQYALEMPKVRKFAENLLFERTNYVYFSGSHGRLELFKIQREKAKDSEKQQLN
ncbi:hypothetical protein HA402_014639 [Bradysia odoriphaga]|nr:hypothetical protein HA402_014639 [Bradysia odoriphaga]